MTPRTSQLRRESLDAPVTLSEERALLMTAFYESAPGDCSVPVQRARSFRHLCEHQTIWIGPGELIVGERGPRPKAVPTFPELTCHSLDDLRILDTREKNRYAVPASCFRAYEEIIIPYWRGRSLRDRLFALMSPGWLAAYEAGLFTEFMEQRAPGHTVLDEKIYGRGLCDLQRQIEGEQLKPQLRTAMAAAFGAQDEDPAVDLEQLQAMSIACDALIHFAGRHAALARRQAEAEADPQRRAELLRIADVCTRVPAQAPRDFHEALQAYWFCHLGVITELNGWDSLSPGHLDQHLLQFYRQGLADGTLTPDLARELIECFFIKFNNHPAPPKVGVTAEESATYTDFANLNLAGLLPDGTDGANELTHLILDIIDEMHLLQPSSNLQLSGRTADAVLKHALRVVRKGYGFPSIFNADAMVAEQLRMGKSLRDARAGGCSGCVETGAFGKESYILTGYFNLPKVLELALHDGADPRTGRRIGPPTGLADSLTDSGKLWAAFVSQLEWFLKVKLEGNDAIEQLYATEMPAPFLSCLIDDCISKGLDYNAGGARYHNRYIQFVGIGSLTDSLAALQEVVYDDGELGPGELVAALDADFDGRESLRRRLRDGCPKYGTDNDTADALMVTVFDMLVDRLDGRPSVTGGRYRVEMLPTTCHVYFGSVTGALPDGRHAGKPLSEGISPVQGVDRRGPTAVIRSAAKMDHLMTGGTLLNLKFTPAVVADEAGLDAWAALVRGYFAMDGHHVQFNVVGADTLRAAQADPAEHRELIVRVAGYSDYFHQLSRALQDEIVERTEHAGF